MIMKGPNIVFDVSRVFHRHFVYHRDIEPAELQKLNLFKDEIEKTFRGGERESWVRWKKHSAQPLKTRYGCG